MLPEGYDSDIIWIFPANEPDKQLSRTKRLDEWGSVWETLDENSMGEVIIPAIKNWDILKNYKWPPINDLSRYEHAKDIINNNPDKYILGVAGPGILTRPMHLRSLPNLLLDYYDYPNEIAKLTDIIVGMQIESINIWHGLGADGVLCGFDDWGTEDRLLIHPELWRRFYKSRYTKIWQYARKLGLEVWIHSCGYLNDIMDDMIEAGLQVIQMDQQQHVGLDCLSKNWGGKICFWNPVDIQGVMIYGTIEEVIAYTKEMMYKLGKFNGGFIGKFYPQLAVNQNGRWNPLWNYAYQAIRTGLIGEVMSVHMRCHWDHNWIVGKEFNKIRHAILYDYGIHWFDILSCWMDKKSKRVFASFTKAINQKANPPLLSLLVPI